MHTDMHMHSLVAQMVKNLLAMQETQVRSLGLEDPLEKSRTWLRDFTFTFHFLALEKKMASHSSVLAWRIPGTGEPGGLPSMGSQSRIRLKWLSSGSSMSRLPWRVLWWTMGYMNPFKPIFSPDICPKVGLLDHMVALFLVFKESL